MTYRYIPARWRLFMQLATLMTTALLGLSILLTPAAVMNPPAAQAKSTQFEHVMTGPIPAWFLIIFGVIGLIGELLMAKWRDTDLIYAVVTFSHTVLFGTYMAYSASVLVTTLRTEHWYMFGSPVLGVLLALWHLMYVQRRRQIPIAIGDLKR